jgi:hypothetical protein
MMAHTPGPWTAVECDGNAADLAIAVSDGGYVCYSVATEADAELIAAAPEMLSVLRTALNELVYLYEEVYADDDSDNDTTAAIDAITDVIAKAERSA